MVPTGEEEEEEEERRGEEREIGEIGECGESGSNGQNLIKFSSDSEVVRVEETRVCLGGRVTVTVMGDGSRRVDAPSSLVLLGHTIVKDVEAHCTACRVVQPCTWKTSPNSTVRR